MKRYYLLTYDVKDSESVPFGWGWRHVEEKYTSFTKADKAFLVVEGDKANFRRGNLFDVSFLKIR